MKIRTYIAKDMRQALRQVRDEQGPDAVILSTRSIPGGVEVAAAVDFESALAAHVPPTPPTPPAPAAPPSALRPPPMAQEDDFASLMARVTPRVTAVPQPAAIAPTSEEAISITPAAPAEVGAELRTMRHLLEAQLAQLAWNDLSRRAPVHAELFKDLTELGLSEALARELMTDTPPEVTFLDAQRRALATVSRRILVTGDALLESGGHVAMVGPTGVGKTTAIAKLAARWVLRHGPRDIALISLDAQRFGAQEQLKVLGRLLGVEAYTLEEVAQLPALLARLPDRRLILIDTAGLSPRDPDLTVRAEQLSSCAQSANVKVCLVLSAGAQAGVLEDAAEKFAAFHPTTCLITKVDEAASLGGTLSMLVRTQMPVSYISEGQRIPEDLMPARAHNLVARAVYLARSAGAAAGEDLLTRRLGGVAHAIA